MAILRGTNAGEPIAGTPGDDTIFGLGGGDVLEGAESLAAEGDDLIYGGADNDLIFGGCGDDRLFGYSGDDIISTFLGANSLFGGAGNDRLQGGPDADRTDSLWGGPGDDTINGSLGRDILHGGPGADRLNFEDRIVAGSVVYETGVGRGNRDRIIDLDDAEGDRINLASIDADVTTPLIDDAFAFVGQHTPGQGELGYVESGGSTIVRGNADSGAAADFEIQLDGTGLNLTASDFIL